MRYPDSYQPEAEDYHPLAVPHSMFVDEIDRRAAETIVEHHQSSTAMMAITQLRVLGGAVARVPDDATAYAHRRRRIMVQLVALYSRPDETPVHQEWIAGFAAALDRGDADVYVNLLGDEVEARVRAAYPGATWDRLAAIKRKYDPDNLFHLNQNVPPAAES
jgi:FAD/FMN-containing dehydrogenase